MGEAAAGGGGVAGDFHIANPAPAAAPAVAVILAVVVVVVMVVVFAPAQDLLVMSKPRSGSRRGVRRAHPQTG